MVARASGDAFKSLSAADPAEAVGDRSMLDRRGIKTTGTSTTDRWAVGGADAAALTGLQ